MPSRIVRDLEKKGSFTISLKDEKLAKPKKRTQNILDLSEVGKQKFVITGTKKSNIDVAKFSPPVDVPSRKNPDQVFFLHIDAEQSHQLDRLNEVIKMVAVGAFILLIINSVNVLHRGIGIKNYVEASAVNGYENLLQAGKQAQGANFQAAEGSFNEATKSFNAALQNIAFLQNNQDTFFAKEKTVESVQELLKAAKNISEAGTDFSKGIQNLSQLPALFLQENGQSIFAVADPKVPRKSLTQKLKEDLKFLEKATTEIQAANSDLANVSPEVLPPPLKDKLDLAKNKVKTLLNLLQSTQEKIPAVLDLLGDRYLHRYLILLQNDTEARPTGGFIGSYIILDMNDGYITKMDFHDVYESDGQLKEEITPPKDMQKVAKNWRLRDSNYSPDFSFSGEKAAWFLQKEKGPSVDTVIAVNQSFLADLLEITGPIQLESLKAPLDKDNYQLLLSYMIESKLSGEESPKKVLAEFIPAFQKKLFNVQSLKKTLQAFIKGYQRKAVLFYSRHPNVQKVFDDMGMTGRVVSTAPNEDYLNVIATSIGGNKSDLYIEQSIQHNTIVNQTGLLIDEIVIDRKHTWTEKELEKWHSILKPFGFTDIPDGIKEILGHGINKSIVKVYVPYGSTLLDTDGIDKNVVEIHTDDEIGKTYFVFEMDVKPEQEQKITLSYQLPANLSLLPVDTYKLYVQNQPALRASSFIKQIFFKPGLQSYREYPSALKKYDSGNLYFDGKLEKDIYLAAVVGQ